MTTKPAVARLDVRVMPRSPRTGVDGYRGGRLVIRVTASPVDGEANRAVIEVIADRLEVPRQAIRLVSGGTSRNKTLEILGVSAEQVRERLPTRESTGPGR